MIAARFLERALLFTLAAHLAAMASMALFLLPGIPGSTPADVADRAAYIANHPWLWRLGWFPWQVTAVSDLILAMALLRTKWIPKLPAILSLLATVAAVTIEQPNEFRWTWEGVELAREAIRNGVYDEFRTFESKTYRLVSLWAATLYAIGAIGWSWAFAAAGAWNRCLTAISIGAWGILLSAGAGPLALGMGWIPADVIAAGNALGFILMMAWFTLVLEMVLRRSRPDESYGRYAPWRFPRRGLIAAIIDPIANSRLARFVGEFLPSPTFVSDITNVIYVNYVVEADRLKPFVPVGLELQRLGPGSRYALFTFLTYRHGHFGPRFLGPLRRLLPSPIQSNWRIHVRDPQTGVKGVYFISTAITALPNALAARFLSEGVAMHLPRFAELTARPDGAIHLVLDPGEGSSPDAIAELCPATMPEFTAPWSECFEDYHAFLNYCVPQDRAMSSQPWYCRVTRQEICLGISLDACEPLEGSVISEAAISIAGDAKPLCFRVAEVDFRYDGEVYDQRTN